jgi:hypothetical protein
MNKRLLHVLHATVQYCNFLHAEALINAEQVQLNLMAQAATETSSQFKTVKCGEL